MNELSYIRYAIENHGLASTPDNVHTKLYYDGKLASKEFRSEAIMDNQVTRSEWAGLSEVARFLSCNCLGPRLLLIFQTHRCCRISFHA